ncbi:MAG: CTP synthase [Deltaproteobacteria bacterium]|nr:CTP synthase [Deltaproteobacteria bacterium]
MAQKRAKFIVVTGGVLSSLGKGLAAASVGALMENRGLKVTFVKLDPYINVDPGTMSPFQHGEVFVTDDGAETDLDLGHYERFSSARMGKLNNFTTGQVYYSVIMKERRGEYLGRTVQVIPHITDEIKLNIHRVADGNDLIIVEVGGTVGDIESLPFLEAVRQLRVDLGPENVLNIHLTYVPYIGAAGELKTKPTQHSVKELLSIGISPDILLCRCDRQLPKDVKSKIALFCNVDPTCVVAARDVETIYEVPSVFHAEGVDEKVAEKLNIWSRAPSLERWEQIVERVKRPSGEVSIGIVGKYVDLRESYKSLNEALTHGGIANDCRVHLDYIDAEALDQAGQAGEDERALGVLAKVDGVLVPGGFGERGIEGKIRAIRYAREARVPFFGICLGMQLAVVEFARHVCGLARANSSEFDKDSPYPVVDLMPDQRGVTDKGATMRLGAYDAVLVEGSRAHEVYGTTQISERHRHRYEVNNAFRDQIEAAGMRFGGVSPDGRLVEMAEIQDHPWFVGCQFHPEFKSKPIDPHPLFARFVRAAKMERDRRAEGVSSNGARRLA